MMGVRPQHSLFIVEVRKSPHTREHYYNNYDKLFLIVSEYLKKGCGVIHAAENNSADKIIKKLDNATAIDPEAYVHKEQLTIIDYDQIFYDSPKSNSNIVNDKRAGDNNYYNTTYNIESLIKRFKSEIKKKKSSGYNHILIVNDCSIFFERKDYDGLIAYDNAINKELFRLPSSASMPAYSSILTPSAGTTKDSIECICCYPHSAFGTISSLSTIKSILLNHDGKCTTAAYSSRDHKKNKYNKNEEDKKKTRNEKIGESSILYQNNFEKLPPSLISSTSTIRPLYPHEKIMEAIISAMDKTMGDNTTNLILKTMKLIYHIDEKEIIGNHNLFAHTIAKLMGESAAHRLLTTILEEMKQNIISS
jgi:hypothetical protein